jgi:hypothetical protein
VQIIIHFSLTLIDANILAAALSTGVLSSRKLVKIHEGKTTTGPIPHSNWSGLGRNPLGSGGKP